MASVRLREDQIRRLREKDNAAAVIRYAVKRWKRGDFAIGGKPKRKKDGETLAVFPLWMKPDGVEDWQLREILDRHWSVRDTSRDAEIARLDREIAEMMQLLPPFFVEDNIDQ